jgi:hypothetical protein
MLDNRNRWVAAVVSFGTFGYLLLETPLLSTLATQSSQLAVLMAGYVLLLGTSGVVVRSGLRFAGTEVLDEEVDTGRAIGKVENVLVFTLTLVGAYTALGLIFTAKSIVRWQDTSSENTTYYLTGSITNFTYSFVYAVAFDTFVLAAV